MQSSSAGRRSPASGTEPRVAGSRGTEPRVAADRVRADLEALAGLVEPDLPGWTRTALGPVDRDGRELVRRWMTEAGLETSMDGAGNVLGRLRGTGSGRTLMVGSHTDTVVGGGRFDGIVGVVGRLLGDAGINIAGMQVGRAEKGGKALIALTVDSALTQDLIEAIIEAIGADRGRRVDLAD